MSEKKKVLAIIGSTRANSSNLRLVKCIKNMTSDIFEMYIFNEIDTLPHFNPDLDKEDPPESIVHFRKLISEADGVLICTPEYVFTLPGSLKNALEWCVSTTIFSQKPTGLITASANGMMGHESLQLVMKTIEANFTEETTLLISGISGKINMENEITHPQTTLLIHNFIESFLKIFVTD